MGTTATTKNTGKEECREIIVMLWPERLAENDSLEINLQA